MTEPHIGFHPLEGQPKDHRHRSGIQSWAILLQLSAKKLFTINRSWYLSYSDIECQNKYGIVLNLKGFDLVFQDLLLWCIRMNVISIFIAGMYLSVSSLVMQMYKINTLVVFSILDQIPCQCLCEVFTSLKLDTSKINPIKTETLVSLHLGDRQKMFLSSDCASRRAMMKI